MDGGAAFTCSHCNGWEGKKQGDKEIFLWQKPVWENAVETGALLMGWTNWFVCGIIILNLPTGPSTEKRLVELSV